jgi:hypothetical protein
LPSHDGFGLFSVGDWGSTNRPAADYILNRVWKHFVRAKDKPFRRKSFAGIKYLKITSNAKMKVFEK